MWDQAEAERHHLVGVIAVGDDGTVYVADFSDGDRSPESGSRIRAVEFAPSAHTSRSQCVLRPLASLTCTPLSSWSNPITVSPR